MSRKNFLDGIEGKAGKESLLKEMYVRLLWRISPRIAWLIRKLSFHVEDLKKKCRRHYGCGLSKTEGCASSWHNLKEHSLKKEKKHQGDDSV